MQVNDRLNVWPRCMNRCVNNRPALLIEYGVWLRISPSKETLTKFSGFIMKMKPKRID